MVLIADIYCSISFYRKISLVELYDISIGMKRDLPATVSAVELFNTEDTKDVKAIHRYNI